MVGRRPADPPVEIAGVGLVTPLAVGAAATFDALMAGRLIWTRGSDRPADPTSLVRRVGTSALASDAPFLQG